MYTSKKYDVSIQNRRRRQTWVDSKKCRMGRENGSILNAFFWGQKHNGMIQKNKSIKVQSFK